MDLLDQKEYRRLKQGARDYANALISEDKKVAYVAPSKVWAFDVHFQRNRSVEDCTELDAWKHHVTTIAWVPALNKLTLACPNVEISEKVFESGGLNNIYPLMPKYERQEWRAPDGWRFSERGQNHQGAG